MSDGWKLNAGDLFHGIPRPLWTLHESIGSFRRYCRPNRAQCRSHCTLPSRRRFHHSQYPAIDPTQHHLDCSEKIILVTGAGSGIDEATAIAFAKANAKGIVLLGRNQTTLQATAIKIATENHKTRTFVVTADITSREQVQSAFTKIIEHLKAAPDVLVNNAGGLLAFGAVADIDIDGFSKTYELNVLVPLINTQAFIRAARSSKSPVAGRVIINILLAELTYHKHLQQSPTAPPSSRTPRSRKTYTTNILTSLLSTCSPASSRPSWQGRLEGRRRTTRTCQPAWLCGWLRIRGQRH